MNNQIAIIMQDNSLSNSYVDSTHINVYEKSNDKWCSIKSIPINIDFTLELSQLREQFKELVSKLGDCEIIACKDLIGIAYHMFNRMGFSIFNIDNINDETFFGIISDIETGNELNQLKQQALLNLGPVEKETSGMYFLDLLELQKSFPDLSSKKALQPFFKETPFVQLELICSHLPPWIEEYGYTIKTSIFDSNKTRAMIDNYCKK